MSLKRKAFLVILICMILILVIWGTLAHTLFLNNYRYLETQDLRSDADHLRTALGFQSDNLSALCVDWAAWDDTYQFMQDKNAEFLQSNFVDGTYANLGLNLVVLYDADGEIVYDNAYDLKSQKSANPNQYVLDYFSQPGLAHQAETKTTTGFLYDKQTPMIYCISPILNSANQGPRHGFLVFGKYLQGNLLGQIQNSVSTGIMMLPYDATLIPKKSSLLPIQDGFSTELIVNTVSSEILETFYFVDDFQGNPILIIKQEKQRAIYQQGLVSLRNMLLAISLTGLTVCLAAMIILDRFLLSRISRLHHSVVAFRENDSSKETIRLEGTDELARLSDEIDFTVKKLVEKQQNINRYLQYTQLMTEISTKFINLPVNKINLNLQETLGMMGKYLDVDFGRILLIRWVKKPFVTQFFEWKKAEVPSIKEKIATLDIKSFRWVIKKFIKGEAIVLSSRDEMPITAHHERELLESQNIFALIALPLSVAEDFIGVIMFGVCGKNRIWDEQTPLLIEVIAHIISNALDRKQTELNLQSNEKYQYRLNQITKTGIKRDNLNSSIRALSRNLRSLLNLDHNWLVLLDETGKLIVYESGKRIFPDKKVYESLETLHKKVEKDIFIYQTSEDQRKTRNAGLDSIGKSFIALPLAAKNQHLGLIILANDTPHSFDNREKSICQQAATQISLAIVKNQSLEESREVSRDLRNLQSAVVEFSAELEITKLQDTILVRAIQLLNAEGGEFFTYDEKNQELLTVSSSNMDKDYKGMRSKIGQGAAGRALALRKTILIKDYSSWSNRMPEYEATKIRASLSSPLLVGEKIIGCISVFHYNPENLFTKNDQHLITIFAQHASIAMDNAILFSQIKEIARMDDMTGLLNRRALFESGNLEISRSERLGRPLAIGMMDLDNFKDINDMHSHMVGDKVLKEISRLLQENLRNIDIIGRFGGDEFVIIMPETGLPKAVKAMERIRQKIDKVVFKVDDLSLHMTACFGITFHENNLPTLEEMIVESDKAMYAAKKDGRNCVRVFQDL